MSSSSTSDDKKLKLDKVYEDIADHVGVAGLKEALQEKIVWIRTIFKIVLFVLTCCAVYYVNEVIIEWLENNYTDEIADVVQLPDLPFPNVTICSQVFINKTFVATNLIIPDKVKNGLITYEINLEQFVEQFTLYILKTTRYRRIDQRFVKYFQLVIDANSEIKYDFAHYVARTLPSCESMLIDCRFNGLKFDCCQKASDPLVVDDGVCYVLELNFDQPNQISQPTTFRQEVEGQQGGLSLEVVSYPDHAPWLEDDAPNGFHVYVHPSPVIAYLSPVPASSNTETFIKVRTSKIGLTKDCMNKNKLPKLIGDQYYDPYGYTCKADAGQYWVRKYFQCYTPYYYYRPNASEVCYPVQLMTLSAALFGWYTDSMLQKTSLSAKDQERVDSLARAVESDSKEAFRSKKECPIQCDYFEYSTMVSYVELVRNRPSVVAKENRTYSKIHIFYTEFAYREHSETKAITGYLAFYNFGNVIGFYLGMSIVGIAHLLYYLPLYSYAYIDYRRSIRKVKTESVVRKLSNKTIAQIKVGTAAVVRKLSNKTIVQSRSRIPVPVKKTIIVAPLKK